jgi:hypothetical protein
MFAWTRSWPGVSKRIGVNHSRFWFASTGSRSNHGVLTSCPQAMAASICIFTTRFAMPPGPGQREVFGWTGDADWLWSETEQGRLDQRGLTFAALPALKIASISLAVRARLNISTSSLPECHDAQHHEDLFGRGGSPRFRNHWEDMWCGSATRN